MKKNMNVIGILILIGLFSIFYIFANFFLEKREITNKLEMDTSGNVDKGDNDYKDEINIISNLYNDVRILYDVVNNRFLVDQEDTIVMGDIIYKKINNFNLVMDNLFTNNGRDKYINDMGNYFAYTDSGYYLAGNLVSYQTYYFRGDNTKIFVTSSSDDTINGIIYEKWTSNNKNTLATIRVVKVYDKWLVDDITLLATE